MEITIPTSLKEITLSQLQQWEASNKSQNELLNIFCGIPDAKLIPAKEADEITTLLKSVLELEPDLVKTFKIGGVEFGFIPKIDSMTGGEYIDLEEFIKNPKDYHKAMCILYRPVIKRKRNWFKPKAHDLYDILPYTGTEKYSELMKEAPAECYLSAVLFFYRLGKDLYEGMMDYSQTIINQAVTQKRQHLTASGAGM